MSVREIGCCGAYCQTCQAFNSGTVCRGCKLGYDDGDRDINKSRCKIKLCCFKDKRLETCADCVDFSSCMIIKNFYNKKGYKYKKYKQSLEFIKENSYKAFFKFADDWHSPYGKLD
jgi:hypothetical protein